MNDPEHTEKSVHHQPAPEVHREREVIVTGGRGSGSSTAIVVIFALIALGVIAFLAFTFMERDGGDILPDDINVNVEVPATGDGS